MKMQKNVLFHCASAFVHCTRVLSSTPDKKAWLKAKNYAQTTFRFYPFSFFTPYAVPILAKSLDLGKEIEQ